MLAEKETPENPDRVYNIQEQGFPFQLVRVAASNPKTFLIKSWDDFAAFLKTKPSGISDLDHIGTHAVLPDRKPISLASIVPVEVAGYLKLYSYSISKWMKGYIYEGGFQSQPNVLIDAFSVIESELTAYEKRQRAIEIANLNR